MSRVVRGFRIAAVALATFAAVNVAHARFVPLSPAALEIYDRNDGSVLQVYEKDGRRYVVGTPGHEYALRIRNTSAARILAVTSVDGVNVISGDTASPDQSGYVIDAYGSVEIAGWRKGLDRIAAFYFTDLGDSYAARTGRPQNVGVIGVAVFREKIDYSNLLRDRRKAQIDAPSDAESGKRDSAVPIPSPMPAAPSAGAAGTAEPAPSVGQPRAAEPAPENRQRAESSSTPLDSAVGAAPMRKQQLASRLGTGHGRSETSYVQQVRFERATSTPAQMLTVQYDRRENLVAMGVLRDDWYARREPQPFPGTLRFAPDPR